MRHKQHNLVDCSTTDDISSMVLQMSTTYKKMMPDMQRFWQMECCECLFAGISNLNFLSKFMNKIISLHEQLEN